MYLNQISLKDRVFVVIGGGRGMGEATSHAVAEAGAKTIVADYNESRATMVASAISKTGGTATPMRVDARDTGMVEALFDKTTSAYGPVEGVINVAGGMARNPWALGADWTDEAFHDVMDLNLKSAFVPCRAAIKRMIKHGKGGVIVNYSSVSGQGAATNHSIYGAGKAALIHLTRTLAWEYGKYGIRINSVAPGTVKTPLVAANISPEREAEIPVGHAADPSEIASVVLFLASDMSSYVTGQTITADGGVSLGRLDRAPDRFGDQR